MKRNLLVLHWFYLNLLDQDYFFCVKTVDKPSDRLMALQLCVLLQQEFSAIVKERCAYIQTVLKLNGVNEPAFCSFKTDTMNFFGYLQAVSERIRSEQLYVFLMTLNSGLLESNVDCVLIVIMVLREVVKKRGSECHTQVFSAIICVYMLISKCFLCGYVCVCFLFGTMSFIYKFGSHFSRQIIRYYVKERKTVF
jgi:hypothetical protein